MGQLRKQNPSTNPRILKIALVDTCFWYALLDERDPYHKQAQIMWGNRNSMQYLIPWPVMYETLRTRLARRPIAMQKFATLLKRPNAIHLDDTRYRVEALSMTLSGRQSLALSLVDNVLRVMISDISLRVDCLYTFNQKDFRDVCSRRSVAII